jgi:hypothetical protein
MLAYLAVYARMAREKLRQRQGFLFLYLLAAFGALALFFGLGYLLWMQIQSWKD